MSTLTKASRQWATRPDDERFTSLNDMLAHFHSIREHSRETVVTTKRIQAAPTDDNRGLVITGPNGHAYEPTHWAFGQLATLAQAPAGYLRNLPAPLAADCVNYGLQFKRDVSEVGILLQREGETATLRAATGPKYGRIWNADIVSGLVRRFGDGVSGDFRVPGEFGHRVEVTKANTTLYAGDRDMFVFLADEDHRIEIPNRRDGEPGTLARGFFVWNSEVGAATFGVATFLFDYVCCNRIVWGAKEYKQVTIRHTSGAPDRYIDQIAPALAQYARSSTDSITRAIADARRAKLDDVDAWLTQRFSRTLAAQIQQAHLNDEGRPVETLWDVSTGITAHARGLNHQDSRVALEREAGKVLDLAA
jgi:hypothetical protein